MTSPEAQAATERTMATLGCVPSITGIMRLREMVGNLTHERIEYEVQLGQQAERLAACEAEIAQLRAELAAAQSQDTQAESLETLRGVG